MSDFVRMVVLEPMAKWHGGMDVPKVRKGCGKGGRFPELLGFLRDKWGRWLEVSGPALFLAGGPG